MSESANNGAGCMLLIGVLALAISLGYFWGAAWGWLAFGVAFIFIAFLGAAA